MLIDKKQLGSLRRYLHDYALKRREVIRETGDALHHAKRVIFALHRLDTGEAEKKLIQAEQIFKALGKKYAKDSRIAQEGAYRAAVEEYVEAKLFFSFVRGERLGAIDTFLIDPEVYLAGLCDVPGELYRYAIAAATAGDMAMVKKCAEAANEIMGELIEFDFTSYLRNKFDQAKGATHKLEQVVYEVSLRT